LSDLFQEDNEELLLRKYKEKELKKLLKAIQVS